LLEVDNLTKDLLPTNSDGSELQTEDMDVALPTLDNFPHHQKATEAPLDVVTVLGLPPLLAPHYLHL
jgi:hypothetical protein